MGANGVERSGIDHGDCVRGGYCDWRSKHGKHLRGAAISLGWLHVRALAPDLGAFACLVAAPRLGGKDIRSTTTNDVAVEREGRVGAAARVADSRLPVEVGGEGGVRIARFRAPISIQLSVAILPATTLSSAYTLLDASPNQLQAGPLTGLYDRGRARTGPTCVIRTRVPFGCTCGLLRLPGPSRTRGSR